MKTPGSIRTLLTGLLLAAGAGLGSVAAGENPWWQASNAYVQMNDPNVTEGVPAVFTIRVPEKLPFAVRWQYRTEDASATAGSDYTAVQGTLAFAIGEREKQITVPTRVDDTVEPVPEWFILELTNLETSADGATWEYPSYIPGVPDYAVTTGTIRDAGQSLDVLVPPDDDTVPVVPPTDGANLMPLNSVDSHGDDNKEDK
ncbi:MAG: hypothetical protein OXE76_02275 [Alphaproteobacteria bacterium]|nr:hypothetical protein [Alphaproteobacteria bacterium]